MHFQGGDSPKERPGWLHAPFGRRPVQSPKNSLTLDCSSPHPPHQGIRPRPNATCNTTCVVATNTASCLHLPPLSQEPEEHRTTHPECKTRDWAELIGPDGPHRQGRTSRVDPPANRPIQPVKSNAFRPGQPLGNGAGRGWGVAAISRSGRSTGRFHGWGPPTYHTETG